MYNNHIPASTTELCAQCQWYFDERANFYDYDFYDI